MLGGTASTEGGIRTPFSSVDQTIIGGKRSAGSQNDILATLTDAIHIGKRPSSGAAWNYIYLVTNQYMVLFPQIQGQFHSSTGHKACWQNEGFSFGSSNSPTWGGGLNVISVQNAATNPTSNPTSSGLLYADAGAGKWRGSGGTTTTFGPADPHCPECGSDHVKEFETEDVDQYTGICMRCTVDYLHAVDALVRLMAASLATLTGTDPTDLLRTLPRGPRTFSLTSREQKESFW